MSGEQRELRFAVTQELRAAGTDQQKRIEGYACTWNKRTFIGPFYEIISPMPFSSLETDNVVCNFNHEDSLLLGRSGVNLELSQDDIGLRFVCTLNDSSVSQDVYKNLKSGLLSECSFQFTIYPGGEKRSMLPSGEVLRTLTNLKLWDVAVVTSPAYSGTNASARNVVPEEVQARMASFREANVNAGNGNAMRKLVAASMLEQIAEENAAIAAAEDECLKSRLQFLKAL
jgi:HK97 family phage prohead protease